MKKGMLLGLAVLVSQMAHAMYFRCQAACMDGTEMNQCVWSSSITTANLQFDNYLRSINSPCVRDNCTAAFNPPDTGECVNNRPGNQSSEGL